jgi:hypothetical protein
MSKMIIEKNMNGKLYVLNNQEGATFVIELSAIQDEGKLARK